MQIDRDFLGSRSRGYATVRGIAPCAVHVRLEGLNPAGSIKLTPALRMIDELERRSLIRSSTRLIESSSGNLGVALGMVCANRGYSFVCVTDPNASPQAVKAMRALGTEVIVVERRDSLGGYLNTRIELIRELCAADPDAVWLNQYANEDNWKAHADATAQRLHADFPDATWLLIGAGTTGTLMGCARHFKAHSPATRVVAVDAAGSVTFGAPAAPRHIPGIGTTRTPEILDTSCVDVVLHVPEANAISACRALARRGLLAGGSTGSVVAAVAMIAPRLQPHDVVVAVSPDMGDKYLDTIYSDSWVQSRFDLHEIERLVAYASK